MYRMRRWSVKNARWLKHAYGALETLLVWLSPVLRRIGYERLDRPVAALTSSIGMLELMVARAEESKYLKRRQAALLLGVGALAVAGEANLSRDRLAAQVTANVRRLLALFARQGLLE